MKYVIFAAKCFIKHLVAPYVLCLALIAGCTTTPSNTVAFDIILERVYCGLTDIGDGEDGDLSYAYDPKVKETDKNIMDTKKTVDQIIIHNAIRDRICHQRKLIK
jgi:hypothetical protein